MQLTIDAGNSSLKVGLFKNNTLLKQKNLANGCSILEFLSSEELKNITLVISCSVTELISLRDLPDVKKILIDHTSNFPFNINYKTPKTLGIDRVVACSSVWKDTSDVLVIDAGSCITYDFVSKSDGYLGGAISPGLRMRFKAMNNFTDKLPFISQIENNPNIIGENTEECLKSGVINGITNEISGFIGKLKLNSPDLIVFLTGGDSIFLGTELKIDIFADQNLVLKGLNSLRHLNEK